MPRTQLPSYETIYNEHIVLGKSYRELGEKYGVRFDSICHKFKRETLKRGLPWPVPGARKTGYAPTRRTRQGLQRRHDLVDARMARAEVKEFLERHPSWTKRDMARALGIAETTLCDLTNHYETVSRYIVQRIESFIAEWEEDAAA